MAKEGPRVWVRNGKGCLRKNPLPIQKFYPAFTCFLFFAGGPTGLCSVLEAFGVNETAVLFER